MNKEKDNKIKQLKRKNRTRAKIKGTASRPRLSVFRSNKEISAQLIDDDKGETLASVHSRELKNKGNKTEKALEAGKMIAERAAEKNIKKAVFDKGSYRYHGRIKALAEGAREGGLDF